MGIEKVIAKLGPRIGPEHIGALTAFLAVNPELIPIILAGGIGVTAILKMIDA